MVLAGLTLLAAVVSLPASTDDADLRCVAAVSFALGTATEGKSVDTEGISGLTAVFMYFMGKIDARRPGLDYARELGRLMNSPGYEKQLPADLVRCGAEAEERGRMLQKLGQDLQNFVPLTKSRPG